MGDDESCHEEWDEDYQDVAGRGETHEDGPEGHDRDGRPAEWRSEGPGRWSRKGAPRGAGQQQGSNAAAAAAQGSAGGVAGGGAAKGNEAGATTSGGATSGDADDGDGARAGKHRRRQTEAEAAGEERAATDARRAWELQRQLEQASAAQERSYRDGNGGFGSEVALSVAAQGFVLQVQRVQAQAGEMGVEPRAEDGRTLLQLSPAELNQWAHDNLGDSAMRD